MYSKHLSSFIGYGFGLTLLTLVIFAALHFFQVPTGHFTDWIIGLVTVWWLLIIVTVPWNVWFEAKGAIVESEISAKVGIETNSEDLAYIKRIAQRAISIAILLHILSAMGLFWLSATGISQVGYVGSACALLLTGLRPSVRAYEYLRQRLFEIKQRIRYPREDVVALKANLEKAEARIESLTLELNANERNSFAAVIDRRLTNVEERLVTNLQDQESLQDENRREHLKLAREAEQSIAKISADTQFLDHVREIVRMIKSA